MYCGNNFTVYVSQTIILYTLNLYSSICQLLLNKQGKKIVKNGIRTWKEWFHYSLIHPFNKFLVRVHHVSGSSKHRAQTHRYYRHGICPPEAR